MERSNERLGADGNPVQKVPLMVKGDSCGSLLECCKSFDRMREVIAKCGKRISNPPSSRDLMLQEMDNQDWQASSLCVALHKWKKEDKWESTQAGEKPPKEAQLEEIRMSENSLMPVSELRGQDGSLINAEQDSTIAATRRHCCI